MRRTAGSGNDSDTTEMPSRQFSLASLKRFFWTRESGGKGGRHLRFALSLGRILYNLHSETKETLPTPWNIPENNSSSLERRKDTCDHSSRFRVPPHHHVVRERQLSFSQSWAIGEVIPSTLKAHAACPSVIHVHADVIDIFDGVEDYKLSAADSPLL